MRNGSLVYLIALLGLGALACGRPADDAAAGPPAVDPAYRREIAEWRRQREAGLRAEGGWLATAGLHWLPEGESSLGSQPMADVVLPASAPARVGTLTRQGSSVRLEVAPGVGATHAGEPARSLELVSDAAGAPTVVELGTLAFHVIERGDRLALRVKDAASPSRQEFTGLDSFPIDPSWRLAARFEPYDPPRPLPVEDVSGGIQDGTSPGAVVFRHGGETHRLDALGEGDSLFLIFADATSGKETYGGGRYLYTDLPGDDGTLVVDFNRAYNPPCAFTPYATCPLPPPQNRLPVAVTAGEKRYRGPGAH
jgi:hypothetical protein